MKLYCENYFSFNHEKLNMSKDISCCLGLLLEKYNESELFSLQKSYGGFLVRTINHYLKLIDYNISDENLLFEKDSNIDIILFNKLINIFTHYSIILIQHNKNDFAKLIILAGIDLINFSKYKYDKNIIKLKNFLFNNLSYNYISEKRYYKSKIFLDKCIEINKSSLDNIITYNNYCLMYIKKMKDNIKILEKKEIKKIVHNIIYYLHLELKELKKRVINKYKDYLKQNIDKNNKNIIYKENFLNKKEITGFLLYNCFYIMKFFDNKEFNKNYNNGLKIILKLLGKHHHISIKMIRINEENKMPLEYIIKNDEGEMNNEIDSSFNEL